MSIYSKVKIGQASSNYSKFDLSSDHLTTTDFGQVHPINCIEHIIGDKVHYEYNAFNRVAPMVFPTYGKIGLRSVAFYCPYYLIADDSEAYLAGISTYAGQPATGRFFTFGDFVSTFFRKMDGRPDSHVFVKLIASHLTGNDTTDEFSSYESMYMAGELPADVFRVVESSTAPKTTFYQLNYKGKYLYKILRTLGYDIPQNINATSEATYAPFAYDFKFNAYPLLAYLKGFADLLLPTSYYSTSQLIKYLHGVKVKDGAYCNSDGVLFSDTLQFLFGEFTDVFYDSDYFTTAWQSPNSVLSTNIVTRELPIVNDFGNSFGQTGTNVLKINQTGNILIQQSTSNVSGFSQTQLNFLRAFDKFVRRNNLTGYREFNAIYARYGIKPSEMRSNYVQILDVRNLDLNVGDVTSTAQTDSTVLGAYSGKGFINGRNSFDYECKDFGVLIHLQQLYVKPIYYQGFRKMVLKNTFYDFYQPEFDGVGPQAISKAELNRNYTNDVFGFTERYNDYRFALSNVTGDFALDDNMSPWHTGRVLSNKQAPVAQSYDFLTYGVDENGNQEYDRIFSTQNVDNPFDHFYQIWNFKVSALRKMKNISQALDLGEGGIELDRNGAV